MKVYVITSGQYSDYQINSVALDLEDAERKCAILNDKKDRYSDMVCRIERYDTEDIKVDAKSQVKSVFWMGVDYVDSRIVYFDSGHLTFEDINEIKVKRYPGEKRIEITATLPKDTPDDKAKKIMLDRIAKFKAERQGIV